MKKNKKIIIVNNQEDEDFEVYTLYPENALQNINHEKKQPKQNAGAEDVLKMKELYSPLPQKLRKM